MRKRHQLWRLGAAVAGTALLSLGNAQAADPVITNPGTTSIGVFTGGDPGEGLDLVGNFSYAISFGAEADLDLKIGDAVFKGQTVGDEVPGALLEAGNRILNWYIVDYGTSQADIDLVAATSSIRWSAAGAAIPAVTLTLENLDVGVEYKFQMMFGEECCNRGFDVFFDDQLVVKDFNPGNVHGGLSEGTQEALITHTYTPKASTVIIRWDGNEASTDYPDHNAIVNAITVEKLGVPVDTDKDGMPDAWEERYNFNPNDPADAAQDANGNGISNLDEFKKGLDPLDTTHPTLTSAKTTPSFDSIVLTFSKTLDESTATNTANYVLSPALAMTSAKLSKGKTVTLTTAPQAPNATAYTLTVSNVKDINNFAVAANTQATLYTHLLTKQGVLKFSYWGDITGTPVQGLLDDPRYPASPDQVGAVLSFNSRDFFPDDTHENYGATLEGFITPAEAGNYRFFIYTDDASQLFLSSDDTEANLAQIAEETGCCNNFTEPDSPRTSEPIALTAGKKYFIRLIYKEGGGGDYGQVAWRKEGDTAPAGSLRPIPGKFLSSAVDLPFPAAGVFSVQTPGANAKNVSPAAKIMIVHIDGKSPWLANNVTLTLDGAAVNATFTKDANVATISYTPPALFPSKSKHTVALTYPSEVNAPKTDTWTFDSAAYSGSSKDVVKAYPGLLMGSAVQTADAGGHTKKAGDRGIDLTMKGGPVVTFDRDFAAAANAAAANDEMSVVFWQQKLDTADSSGFALSSPTAGNNRVFHAHVPWSNQHIYFDTTGCCDGLTQRIEAGIDTFPDYTGEPTWWTSQWHFFAFTKKGSTKNIYVDGKPFLAGDSTNPLQTDIDSFYMGAGGAGAELSHAIIDDYSVYGKELAEADIAALYSGTAPTALPATKGLIAYWDFNAPITTDGQPPAGVSVTIAKSTANVTISWSPAGGTLESSPVLGTGAAWTTVGTANPATVAIGTANLFYRVKQ